MGMPRHTHDTGILRLINAYLHRNKVGEILVAHGKLTVDQLREALHLQRHDSVPLGHLLINRGIITRYELGKALLTQSALRTIVATLTLLSSVTYFSPRQALAGQEEAIPASITVAYLPPGAMDSEIGTNDASLFGTSERSSTDLSSFTKWTGMFDRFTQEVTAGRSQEAIQKWRKALAAFRGLPLQDMARDVNDMMNKVRYIGDNRNWGKSDYWETPVEFLTKGGDCEDFAIAKYVSLRALGVPDKAMRVAIVRDLQKNIPHAVLIVYTSQGPMVLDNQIKTMTKASEIKHYKPIFSINQTAWWLHSDRPTSNPSQIASAAR